MHIERKGRLERDDMVAIARRGVLDSLARRDHDDGRLQLLRRGGDRCRRARACARSSTSRSSRAIPRRPSASSSEKRARIEESALVRIGVSPHAPYTCSLDVYRWCLSLGIPVGTHLAESANENEWLEHGSGPARRRSPILVAADREARRRDPRAGARPGPALRPLRRGRRRRDRAARRTGRPGRALPALERAARLRHRAARRAPRGRRARRPRNGLAGLDAVVRHVRGDAHGDLHGARPRASAPRRSSPPMRCALATLDAARALRLEDRGGYPDARQARRPDGRVARGKPVPSGRGSRSGRRLRRLAGTSARDDRRRPHPLRKRGHRTVARGTQHRKRRPAANARTAAVAAPKKPKPPAVAGGAVLLSGCATTRSGCSSLLAVAFVLGFVLFGVGSGSTGISDVLAERVQLRLGGGGTSISKLQKKAEKHPKDATAWRDLATRLRAEAADAGRRQRARALHRAPAEGPERARRARVAVRDARDELRDRLPERAGGGAASSRRPARRSRPRRRRRSARPSPTRPRSRIRSQAAVQSLASTKQSTAYSNFQTAQQQRRGGLQEARAR